MCTPAVNLLDSWRAFVLIAIIPALTNCSRIDGSVELNNSSGEPYSFAGAQVDVFDMDRNAAIAGETKIRKGRGSVDIDGESISLQVITASIDDNALYDVEIRCPSNNTADACNVESPLHVVLTGTQLKASGWRANALTELAFHNIAYYVTAEYSAAEIAQVLDNTANALLFAEPPATTSSHDDMLAWNPALMDAVKRPGLLNTVSEALAAGTDNNDIKLLARQSVNPYVTSVDLSAQWTGESSIKHVTIADDYAYLAGDGTGLGIVDISNPELPVAAGYSSEVSSSTPAIVAGNLVYVAGSGRLQIVDVSNPQLPQVVGQLAIDGHISALQVSNGHAFVATDTALHIIDVSNPAAPTLVGNHEGEILFMAVSAITAYLIDLDYNLQIVDVGNPAAPVAIGSMSLAGFTTAITAADNYVYLTFSTEPFWTIGGLQIVDVSNPAAPTYAAPQLDLTPEGREIALSGTSIYVATHDSVQVIDVADATAPRLKAKLGMPSDGAAWSVAATEKFAFVVSGARQLSVLDSGIASQPVVESGGLALADSAWGHISSSENYAYLQNTNSLRDQDGVWIFDFSNPLAPMPAGEVYYVDYFSAALATGDYAYATDSFDSALRVIDLSNPADPVVLEDVFLYLDADSTSPDAPGVNDVVLSGDYLYLPWGNYRHEGDGGGSFGCTNPDIEGGVGGLFIVDVSTPRAPMLSGHLCATERAEAAAVYGDHAYLAIAGGLLQVVDISDPTQPLLSGSVNLTTPASFVAVTGNYVWTAHGENGIAIINVSDSAAPVMVTSIDTPGFVSSIVFDERHAYVADGASGVLVFDLTTPALPLLTGGISTHSNAFSVLLNSDYLIAATGYGFEVFKSN